MTGKEVTTKEPAAPDQERPSIVIIAGPTGSGKTELALHLAERFDGEIVNADSMQVYRGMDIGTAKPDAGQRRRVPHHLIDIIEPHQDFSASDFRLAASQAIADILSRGRKPFVVGGTGLYIKALLYGLVDSPSAAEDVRQKLRETALAEGSESLLQQLAQVDPETAARLHPNDQVRIIRALEVYLQTGRPISSFRSQHEFREEHYRCLKLGIAVERKELYRRIDARVDAMMAAGFLEEVRALLNSGCHAGLKTFRSIGYKELAACVAGRHGLDEAVRLIKRDSRRYAKRQLTWFRQDDEINWVEYPERFDSICNHVIQFFCPRGEEHAENAIQYSGPVSEPIPQGKG